MEYSKRLITFDIETTTFAVDDNHYTDMYLASFFSFNFVKNPDVNKIEKSRDIQFCRTWSDVNKYLKFLNSRAREYDVTQVIFIHNLAYEFDGLIKNCDFVRRTFNNKRSLFIKSRKPATIRCDHIEFRCSFVLLNKSLKALGNQYNYPKLDIDYKAQYFSFSKLPAQEYKYNERDVKLTMYAILRECAQYDYIDTVADIPHTFTSFTRELNKTINDKKSIREYKNRNAVQKTWSHDFIHYLEQIYTGGYTHANAFYSFKILNDVISVDITSSYPDSMINRLYPYDFKECKKNKLKWFKYMVYKNMDYNKVLTEYNKPFQYAFFVTVKLKNVELKKFKQTELPYISISKVINDTYYAVSDNGRLVSADYIEIAITHIDYFLIQMCYDFELISVDRLYYTSQFRPLADFSLNCVRYYADAKSVLKKALKNVDNLQDKDFYCKRTNRLIFDIDVIDNLINSDDKAEQLHIMLANAKSQLNAQYGINVQRLFQDDYVYNAEFDEYVKTIDYNLPRDLFRNFAEGLFIPAYSRLNLFMFGFYILFNSHADLIYSDTDSWKIYTDNQPLIMQLIQDYNDIHNNAVNSNDFYNIGQFDFEQVYTKFCVGGCKKYIYLANDEIGVTIAGLPKKSTQKAFNELYTNICLNDFDFFCKIAFKPNTMYSYTISGKLCSKYNTDDFDGIVTDENGATGRVKFNNMVELVDTDYILLNTDTPQNYTYLRYIQYKQKRKINCLPTIISRSDDGAVQYDYADKLTEPLTMTEVNSDNYIEVIDYVL